MKFSPKCNNIAFLFLFFFLFVRCHLCAERRLNFLMLKQIDKELTFLHASRSICLLSKIALRDSFHFFDPLQFSNYHLYRFLPPSLNLANLHQFGAFRARSFPSPALKGSRRLAENGRGNCD